ncbi:MAG: AAA family ATPase [Candidatus Hodarchaeota archaeon]
MSHPIRTGIGFDLTSIEVYRFMNYSTPVKFEFAAPYIVISGPTGSGKTTILDALTFVLFGRSSRLDLGTVKIEDICKTGGKVLCHFKTGKDEIRVERGRDRKGKSYLELRVNNKRIPGKIPELNEKIRSTILGMNYQAFVNSTIIRQDEMKELGSKSSTERLKTLQNLFRLDIFEKAIIDTQKQLQILSIERSRIEGELKAKNDELLRIDQLKENLNEIRPKMVKFQKNLRSLRETIVNLEKQEEEQRINLNKYQAIQEKEKDAQNRYKSLEKDFKIAQEELEKYEIFQKNLSELELRVQAMKDLEEKINILERKSTEYDLIADKLNTLTKKKQIREDTLRKDLENKLNRMKAEHKRIKDLDTTIDHETAFKILNREGRLLERIQRISLEQSWSLPEKLIEELKQEQIQARKDLQEIQNRKTGIKKESFVLSEIQKRITELEEDINKLEIRLKNAITSDEKEISIERQKLEKMKFSPKVKQTLIDLRTKHVKNLKIQERYEKAKTEFGRRVDPRGKVSTIQEQMKKTKLLIKDLKTELEGYPELKIKYNDLLEKLKIQGKEEEDLKIRVARLDERINNLSREIKEKKQLKPEVEKLEQNIKELIKNEEVLDRLRTDVFHTKGAPFFAISKILPRLGKRASTILSELTNQRFNNIQLQKIEHSRKGMGFEILLRVPDGIRDVATFSGGEKTQINAALRLAISEEISELSQVSEYTNAAKKTLFIDEGDLGSLDTLEAQQAFVTKLFKLTNRFKIILITHLTDVANQFPNSINITRDRYGRSVRENITPSK